MKSESIAKLSLALSKAQGAIEGAQMDANNPHFKSKYATLASCWEACRQALKDNELAVTQIPSTDGRTITVTTILSHSSGEFIQGSLSLNDAKGTPQSAGSCITYARRYALCAFLGIAPEDDDGNDASAGNSKVQNYQKKVLPPAKVTEKQIKRLYTLLENSTWTTTDFKARLRDRFDLESTTELNAQQYNVVCDALLKSAKPAEEMAVSHKEPPKS